MSQQSYLIDTNILIGLEDNRTVDPAYARFLSLAAKHKVGVYVHEVARDDISRDRDSTRRGISLSKINKYLILERRHALTQNELEKHFGSLKKDNDVVDATLLHALKIDAADFLVTQDRGLHERAQKHSPDLARRVLFVGDAADLLRQTYEPRTVPIRHVAEVAAHTIDHEDAFFDSLRDGYGTYFNTWWKEKCVKQRRPCWVVYDNQELAGLIVRKDETAADTDAVTKAPRILKVCTFKVRPEKRGVKLGELLLKQVLWYSQSNKYDLAYLTTYKDQAALITLLEYYGFRLAGTKADGEQIYERAFSSIRLVRSPGDSTFDSARKNYPRFLSEGVRGFGIPIKEDYHDTLYPDLWNPRQADLFLGASRAETPTRPGNTIRKVYLCRAQSNLAEAGSMLFFYKSMSKEPPSQAMTALGILEEVTWATSTKELMLKTGGRSVYSEAELEVWKATTEHPVKVINFLLVSYIQPSISLDELCNMGVIKGNPPQSIYEISGSNLRNLLERSNLGFSV
jgi:ribosomal protein S18 acetylase RimI-like enzyme